MFKRVKSVFKRDGKEPKEKKYKEPKEPKKRGFLRKRGGRIAESEVLPAAHDSQFIPPSHDGTGSYHHGHPGTYAGSAMSHVDENGILLPPGSHNGGQSLAPTMMVPPPTIPDSVAGHSQGIPHNDQPFPRVSYLSSTNGNGTHIAYPASRGGPLHSGPSAASRGRAGSRRTVDRHSGTPSEDDDQPPLPVPPPGGANLSRSGTHRVPTRAPTTRDMHAVPVPPRSARSIHQRNASRSRSRSRSGERRLDRHASTRSGGGRTTTRAAPPPVARDYGENDYGAMDPSGLFRRIKNLYSLEHPDFGFSRCTGTKKAVCIGINYTGSSHELDGCVSDAKRMARFLKKLYNFESSHIMVLTDDSEEERNQPTRKNILAALQWLSHNAEPHDSLFFHYSGHGGQIKDQDGDEVDGLDEMIFPVDYQQNGIIIDDDLHNILIKPLPRACRLTAVVDSCHSGSILDLVYLYHSDGRIMGTDVTPRFKQEKMTPAEVLCWSGSSDAGTSADISVNGLQVGAMSYAFTKALRDNPNISFADLLRDLRRHTRKYNQRPQLSASHRVNVTRRFRL